MSTAVATRVRAGAWSVDRAHSKVAFAVKHMGIANVRGQFEEFEGTLEIGNDLSSAKVYGKVNAQSVDTNEPRRDEHLRSPDFLDAARFPEIAFESSRIEALDGDRFRITGRLTIHGVTNELVLHAGVHGTHTDLYGNERIGLEVTGTLSRGDYGMRFNMGLGSGNSSWATRSTWRWTSPPSSTAEHLSAGRRRAPASCATRRDRQRTSLPVRCPPDGASWPRPPPGPLCADPPRRVGEGWPKVAPRLTGGSAHATSAAPDPVSPARWTPCPRSKERSNESSCSTYVR